MFRYLALVWDARDQQQSRTAELLADRVCAISAPWRTALHRQGLRVFCADAGAGSLEARPLPENAGVVLGAVFERTEDCTEDAPMPRAALDAQQTDAILATGGRWLIERCWGNYVALFGAAGSHRVAILKDPCGTLPCFRTQFRGVHVVFSCIAVCVEMRLWCFTVNRHYLRARVMGIGAALEQSALEGVQQIRRGEYVEVDVAHGSVQSRFLWRPDAFTAERHLLEDPDLGARAMRATVRSCTRTWARSHPRILHRLSGGLDSSIVAGCLKDASGTSHVTCYTYYHERGRCDERRWARLAAEHAGLEHIECPVSPADLDLRMLVHMHPMAEPTAVMGYLHRSAIEKRIAQACGASAVFTGDGGDSGLCSDSLQYAACEYLRDHGLRPTVLRLAAQVALRTERSTIGVLAEALSRFVRRFEPPEHAASVMLASQLVSADVRASFQMPECYPHPWFRDARRFRWATLRRVGVLVATPEFYDVCAPDEEIADVVSPLYAQPAVELFLRIPVYRHFEGGADRGLARRAFHREVPEPIRRRLWKDRLPGFHDEIIHLNRGLLSELLLDGVLVREGVLDRAALAQALSAAPSCSTVLPIEIFKHLDVEIWARQWMRG